MVMIWHENHTRKRFDVHRVAGGWPTSQEAGWGWGWKETTVVKMLIKAFTRFGDFYFTRVPG